MKELSGYLFLKKFFYNSSSYSLFVFVKKKNYWSYAWINLKSRLLSRFYCIQWCILWCEKIFYPIFNFLYKCYTKIFFTLLTDFSFFSIFVLSSVFFSFSSKTYLLYNMKKLNESQISGDSNKVNILYSATEKWRNEIFFVRYFEIWFWCNMYLYSYFWNTNNNIKCLNY